MVEATLALNIVMTKTPRKLKNAAMRIAAFGPMALVETQVAMAVGGVGPAIDENYAQSQHNGDRQNRAGKKL